MKRLSYSGLAREDLVDIWVRIAVRDPKAADRVYDRVEASCHILAEHPKLGRARPDIAEDARMFVVERWLALYRIVTDGIEIVRVIDGARDLTQLEWPAGGS